MLLAADPEIVLLDEPMAGVSVEEIPGLVEVIRSVQAERGQDGAHGRAPHPRRDRRRRSGSRSCTTAACSPWTRPKRSWRTRRSRRPTSGSRCETQEPAPARCSRCGTCTSTSGRRTCSRGSRSTFRAAASPRCSGRNGVGKTTTHPLAPRARPSARQRRRSTARSSAACPTHRIVNRGRRLRARGPRRLRRA